MAAVHRVTISMVAVAAAAHHRGVVVRETTESARGVETETGSAGGIAVVIVIVIEIEAVETVTAGGSATGLENETGISGHLGAATQMVGWKTKCCGVSEKLQWARLAALKHGQAGVSGKK